MEERLSFLVHRVLKRFPVAREQKENRRKKGIESLHKRKVSERKRKNAELYI